MACAIRAFRRAAIAMFCLALVAIITSPSAAEVKWEGRAGNDVDKKSEAKIRAALATPTTIDFVETPLIDTVTYLKDLHFIEIQLDSRALEEAGISADTPVTRTCKEISLASGLRLFLKPLELTYVVKDGVLLLTTPEAADAMVELRVYDVRELLGDDDDAEDLAGVLEKALFPQPIVGMGGMGGGMGMGMGGMGMGMGTGGMGGGMFAVKDQKGAKNKSQPSTAPAQVIVKRDPPHITPYRHALLVRASALDHERLASTLDELREKLKSSN